MLLFAAVFRPLALGMRDQVLVGDRQFLRSMIPHHSGAILMCEQRRISADPEISLCQNIIVPEARCPVKSLRK